LKNALIDQLSRTNFEIENNVIMIDLNIDGLPISKSSKSQILADVADCRPHIRR